MITRVVLDNWKSHAHSELDFTAGTNVLLGVMGAGKSSLLGAIAFALFGDSPETRARRAKLDDLMTSRPFKAGHAQVQLFFRASDGKEYSVLRKIERGEGSVLAELRQDGKLIEGPQPAKVSDAVARLLGVDYDLFMQAVYLEQNQLDAFLSEGKGRRRERLDDLFGITRIEEARKTLLSVMSSFRQEAEVLGRERLDEAAKSKAAALSAENSLLAAAESELAKKKAELAEVAGRETTSASRLAVLEKAKSELDGLSSAVEILSRKEADLAKRLAAYPKVGDASSQARLEELAGEQKAVQLLASRAAAVRGSISSLEKRRDDLARRLSRFAQAPPAEAGPAAARAALEEADSKAAELSGKLRAQRLLCDSISRKAGSLRETEAALPQAADEIYAKAEAELLAMVKEEEALLSEKSIEEKALALLGSGAEACPVCGSPIGRDRVSHLCEDKHRAIGTISLKLTQASARRQEAEAEAAKRKAEFARFQRLAAEIASLRAEVAPADLETAKLVTFENAFSQAAEEKARVQRELDDSLERARLSAEMGGADTALRAEAANLASLEKELAGRSPESLASRIDEARALAESFRVGQELAGAQAELASSRKRLGEIQSSFSAEALEKARAERAELAARKAELSYAVSSLPGAIAERKARADSLGKELSDLEMRARRKAAVQKGLDSCSLLDGALKGTEEGLRGELTREVNAELSAFWSDLYPYEDFSGLRLQAEEQDYLLQLKPAGGAGEAWEDVDRVASGGERSIACLALRIAFAKVLAPRLRWLILDEPTHNLDASAVTELADVLRERISGMMEQVILITHEEDLEAAATGNCYRLERAKAGEATTVKKLAGAEDA